VAADGMHFTTHDGRKVVDGISSLWCVGAGHNRRPIAQAISTKCCFATLVLRRPTLL
jgi:beta-alanine--pyruvate transaminase